MFFFKTRAFVKIIEKIYFKLEKKNLFINYLPFKADILDNIDLIQISL